MSRDTWSTSMVATDDRFDFWSDAICEAILNVEARRPLGDGFEAEISCNRLDLGNFAWFRSVSHDIVRSRRMLSQRPDNPAVEAVAIVRDALRREVADRRDELLPPQ